MAIEALPVEALVGPVLDLVEQDGFEVSVPDWFPDVYAGKYRDVEAFLDGTIAYVRTQDAEEPADQPALTNWRGQRCQRRRSCTPVRGDRDRVAVAADPTMLSAIGHGRRTVRRWPTQVDGYDLQDGRRRGRAGSTESPDPASSSTRSGTASTTACSGCPAHRTHGRAELRAACWAGGCRGIRVASRRGGVLRGARPPSRPHRDHVPTMGRGTPSRDSSSTKAADRRDATSPMIDGIPDRRHRSSSCLQLASVQAVIRTTSRP